MSIRLDLIFMTITTLILFGCGSSAPRTPSTITTSEALQVLRRAEAFARAGDMKSLCGMSESIRRCEWFIEWSGGVQAVPSTSPKVVADYVVPEVLDTNGASNVGGRMLILEGIDGLGKSYRTEFLVLDTGKRLEPYVPIYWSGMYIVQPAEPISADTPTPNNDSDAK